MASTDNFTRTTKRQNTIQTQTNETQKVALINSRKHIQKPTLRGRTVAFYDIRPGNGAGRLFLQPRRSPHSAIQRQAINEIPPLLITYGCLVQFSKRFLSTALVSQFVCLFVCLLAGLSKNYTTDFHEISVQTWTAEVTVI